jgi:hypothetical protein
MVSKAIKQLRGKRILARDGPAGWLNEVYVDGTARAVRYLALTDAKEAGPRLILPSAAVEVEALGQDTVVLRRTRAQLARAVVSEIDAGSLSAREVSSYDLETADGAAGQVVDIVVRFDWSVAALIVVTRDWLLPGAQVEVPAGAIASIHRARRLVRVKYTEAQMRRLPRAGWRLKIS